VVFGEARLIVPHTRGIIGRVETGSFQLSFEVKMEQLLKWCTSIVGFCQIVSGDPRPDARSSTFRLQTEPGYCYLKVHQEKECWEREVHGYERWAPAFGTYAPPLLAIHEERPLALLLGELPGAILENVQLAADQERAAWHTAGQRLAVLHAYDEGAFFGPCGRDGTPIGPAVSDAREYVATELGREIDNALRAGYLDDKELAVLRTAQRLAPAFAGERPVPCHRDYCPYNWLVTEEGDWVGVIDFEFAYWDVRVAEFSRYPDWEWIHRPDLVAALLDGYGRPLTPLEEQQCLVARAQYALSAITWGMEAAYYGFVAEGRQALKLLAELICGD
jgi:Ser/Thr protein kinase RdoA (MazF antagonist)